MLVFAVDYQRTIRALVADDEYDLQQYMMSANEWKIVQQLCDILKVLRDATEFFSQSVPNLANVIPAMDYIDEQFVTDAIDEKYSVAIRASLSVVKRTLNRYYNLTDDSHVYRIAMVLHPAYKLKYFHDHGWEPEWIETAWQLVRDGWDHSYASVELEADEIEEAEGPAKPSQNMFDNMASISRPTRAPQDELTRYLTAATENVPDPILWWKTHKSLYPRLYHMAIDYLTIPATSVAVERLFSCGRILIPHLRNRLSPQTIRALLCLGEWSLLGFVRDSDIIKVAQMNDVEDGDGDDYEIEEGWDAIDLS
ncbi:hypothetical protein EWM64_g10791 [Hericium alpestre]|uniref:HAT C-terminal dimerisation domain-containing protein n=1 Tax=Hericium alpestre TaxID=135208 RepID=A0A4Y9ZHC5_9AGAM|nr:hypothetical protein EWM64_g10791 [Hericium alpestre]